MPSRAVRLKNADVPLVYRLRLFSALAAFVLFVLPPDVSAQQSTAPLYPTTEPLRLADYLQRVLERNNSIQARIAAFHAARSLYRSEKGYYEPVLVGSTNRIDRQRPNTIELERSLRSGGVFIERNWIYSAGVEVRTPLGGRVRVGASARELRNNVQRTVIVDLDAEFETSTDVVVEQPLLKNAGFGVASAPRRMAAKTAEVAFQDYRRELMQTIAQAEIAYWELALAQEQLRLSQESVEIARSLYDDNKARFEAGRGPELDVLEAQAGLAMRHSRTTVARQRLVESVNRVAAFFAGRPEVDGVLYQTIERPRAATIPLNYAAGAASAMALSPDLLRAIGQLEQERIRVGVARNQRLPQVDLTGAFSSVGLGFDWDTAYRDVRNVEFPQWEVGVQFRIPLGTGIREKNELLAARQRLIQAERNVRELEALVRTELDAAIKRVEASEATAASNRETVRFRETLLRDRMSAREAGRMDTRIVLEAEQELLQARLELLDSEIEIERAVLELQLLQGNLLANRGLELSLEELDRATREWIRDPQKPLDALHYAVPTAARLK